MKKVYEVFEVNNVNNVRGGLNFYSSKKKATDEYDSRVEQIKKYYEVIDEREFGDNDLFEKRITYKYPNSDIVITLYVMSHYVY